MQESVWHLPCQRHPGGSRVEVGREIKREFVYSLVISLVISLGVPLGPTAIRAERPCRCQNSKRGCQNSKSRCQNSKAVTALIAGNRGMVRWHSQRWCQNSKKGVRILNMVSEF